MSERLGPVTTWRMHKNSLSPRIYESYDGQKSIVDRPDSLSNKEHETNEVVVYESVTAGAETKGINDLIK